MGWAQADALGRPAEVGGQPQNVVCFTEAPLEHLYAMVAEIDNRSVHLRPYGLALTKMKARRKGVNPVWYIDRTAGAVHQWALAKALDKLAEVAVADADRDGAGDTGRVLPFIEPMGTWPQGQREFWWEREWRNLGDFDFTWPDIALWLCPEDEHEDFRDFVQDELEWPVRRGLGTHRICFIDPAWSLERIIAGLVGQLPADTTPFVPH